MIASGVRSSCAMIADAELNDLQSRGFFIIVV